MQGGVFTANYREYILSFIHATAILPPQADDNISTELLAVQSYIDFALNF